MAVQKRVIVFALLWTLLVAVLPHSARAQDDTETVRATLLTALSAINDYDSMVITETYFQAGNVDAQTSVFTGTQGEVLNYTSTTIYIADGGDGFPNVHMTATIDFTQDDVTGSIAVEFRSVGGVLYMNVIAAENAEEAGETLPDGWVVIVDALDAVEDFDDLDEELFPDSVLAELGFRFFSPTDIVNPTLVEGLEAALSFAESNAVAPDGFTVLTAYELELGRDDYFAIIFDAEEQAEPFNQLFFANLGFGAQVFLDEFGNFAGQYQSTKADFVLDDLSLMPGFPADATGTIGYSITGEGVVTITDINTPFDPVEAPVVE